MRTDRRLQSLLQTQRELMCKELWLYSEWGVCGGEVGHVVALLWWPTGLGTQLLEQQCWVFLFHLLLLHESPEGEQSASCSSKWQS